MKSIIQTMSLSRFETYLKAAGFDEERALQLYVWNARIGGAFQLPIQAVEVSLRNCINSVLIQDFGQDWYDSAAFKGMICDDRERQSDLKTMRTRLRKRRVKLENGQVVATLSFGFWVGLLAPKYNPPFWGRNLRKAFPHVPETVTRKTMFDACGKIARFRNRIFHHEPIIKADIGLEYAHMLEVLGYMCPDTLDFIRRYSEIPELLRSKP